MLEKAYKTLLILVILNFTLRKNINLQDKNKLTANEIIHKLLLYALRNTATPIIIGQCILRVSVIECKEAVSSSKKQHLPACRRIM